MQQPHTHGSSSNKNCSINQDERHHATGGDGGRIGRRGPFGLFHPAVAGKEWPDGPNKKWLESLERPDNGKHPERQLDPKSLSCCGVGDTVKTKFKVENQATNAIPKIVWYAWLKDEWVRVPPEKIVPDFAPDGRALSVSARRVRSNASCRLKVAYERPAWRSPQLAPLSRSCCLQTPL